MLGVGSCIAVNMQTVLGCHCSCVDKDIHVRTSYQFFYLKSIKTACTLHSHICYAWLTSGKKYILDTWKFQSVNTILKENINTRYKTYKKVQFFPSLMC